MGFKDRLREKRVEANLTQAALAEKVSVTARTIQNYELGSRKPTKYEVVKKTAEALNTTPEKRNRAAQRQHGKLTSW